jgi:hypothetical protein
MNDLSCPFIDDLKDTDLAFRRAEMASTKLLLAGLPENNLLGRLGLEAQLRLLRARFRFAEEGP